MAIRFAGYLALIVAGWVLAGAPARADWVSAGPIWNNMDAQGKCPRVCAPGVWDGNWNTVVPGQNSVCSCHRRQGWGPYPRETVQVDAGPIWNNGDAQGKCPRVCGGRNRWDGNWRTVAPGRSTCDCFTGR